jgi:ubiquinone/menaquinone biosynthesis C-methylase UbiE
VTADLVEWLADPVSGERLALERPEYDGGGRILSGTLASPSGARYPIRLGIPRFVDAPDLTGTVQSFGDQWNYFNFVDFRAQWLELTVRHTFGSADVFRDKVIVDAGAGSGAQAVWMLQSGAKRVILLELSHSVEGVVRRNLEASGFANWDIVQCSIDAPPLRAQSIDLVMCHNVIQHTPSVEKTAHALFRLVRPGGEFVFNCYPKNDQGVLRWIRLHCIFEPLRAILSRCPFRVNLAYATALAALRLVPLLGPLLEKSGFCSRGVVLGAGGAPSTWRQRFAATRLNTFDAFGSHAYQHLKTDEEIRALLTELQPEAAKIGNLDRYFSRPPPIGCALRVQR